jgi:hypothetical protein
VTGERVFLATAATAVAILFVLVSVTRLSTESTPTRIYWGAYNPKVPWRLEEWEAFEQQAGKGQAIVHWGQPWVMNGRFQPFHAGDYDGVRDRGSIPMVNWDSWELGKGRDQPEFALREISSGRYDDYIRSWAVGAKAWGHPLFVRFNHEMNGWWLFPWAEQVNGNQPGDYVAAWRHVHDIFTEVDASNVTWVWSPNIVGPQTTPLANLYPGDAYVDWVAMDGYNATNDSRWRSFAEVYGPTYAELRALAPDKPIMLAEWASKEEGGDKAAWIEDALLVQLPQHFPHIKAVVWFNWNDSPAKSYTIDSSPEALAAFRRGIGSDYYAGNEFATFSHSPIMPLDR